MICEVKNPLFLSDILKLAGHIPDTPIEALKNMLINGFTSKDAKIIVHRKDNEVLSFVYASIEGFQGEDCVFIQSCYANPDDRYIVHEFITRLKTWAKERGLKRLAMITRRNPGGFERRYHFKPVSTIMIREV